jgi:hypothetical protein
MHASLRHYRGRRRFGGQFGRAADLRPLRPSSSGRAGTPRRQRALAKNLRQATLSGAPHQLHLPQPVLGGCGRNRWRLP